ncbi:Twinfilin-1 [Pseudocyphellaria aurata]|nr:Twinfilin-1 [Pseudocyphellaria aurata]
MQSGIIASQELHSAFNSLVSTPSQRGLLASIQGETLVPKETIPSNSPSFLDDLAFLSPLILPTVPVYLILRLEHAPDGFVAITYVPDAAPVRQKTLFASTRLTLVRELGTERFRETLFVTEKRELEREGWERHEQSKRVAAPLTEEEERLKGVKDAEAEARGGSGGKRAQFGTGASLKIDGEVRRLLEDLRQGSGDNLVQLKINIQSESIELAGTSSTSVEGLAGIVSDTEPRYSLFRYTHDFEGAQQSPLIFIYTCPSGSIIRERMIYASSKLGIIRAAEDDLGLEFAKKVPLPPPLSTSQVDNWSQKRRAFPIRKMADIGTRRVTVRSFQSDRNHGVDVRGGVPS